MDEGRETTRRVLSLSNRSVKVKLCHPIRVTEMSFESQKALGDSGAVRGTAGEPA